MARSSIDRESVEYIKVPVTPPSGVTISAQVVEIAVVAQTSRPITTDWRSATWVGTNIAQVLIGPGQLQLAAGTYNVWVRVTDVPEIPVLIAGTITVT